ncbi:putative phage tail protein [Microvirga lupini]|uniref:Putative phage tail protein n=1 Tax=Microvirga lupini TaxID=420324 RepID=A0A7W4VNV7_9HYPH|nr:host specificity factor TipJ family phage tail protein [Microvirga lupini]MBB3020635.1 putative phage tail protein [Microvirga lupini]
MTLIAQRALISRAEVRPDHHIQDRRRRRLSTLVRRHADRSRSFIVSVHRMGQPVAPTSVDVVLKGEWKDKLVGPQDIVLITYLPQGGKGGGGQILMAIAAIALSIIVPFAVAAVPGLGAVGGGLTFAGKLVSTGIIMGSMALLSSAFKPKANKPSEDSKPVYGVSGGGNLPRPGDRIPRLYGRCWTVPDLSQSDYFEYQGEHQILRKRMTVTLGRAKIYAVRVNGQTLARWPAGISSGRFPSESIRAAFEGSKVGVIGPGVTSDLVPGDVLTSPNVQGNELVRPDSPIADWTGPFLVADPDVTVNKIQLDISAPQGAYYSGVNSKGGFEAAVPIAWEFQYAAVNDFGDRVGDWKTLHAWTRNNGILSKRPLRWTHILNVPEGRYMVRGRNLRSDEPPNDKVTFIANALQWDGLRGHINDKRVRPHVTEIAIEVKSSEALGVTSFANIEVEASSILPVWNGAGWVNEETNKAVWVYADVMRNATYGAAIPDASLDLDTLKFYADTLGRFDTFNGVIRGPDSVWNVASTVLFPLRAEPVQLGRMWSLVRDDRKDLRPHVITSRQIVGGSSGLTFDLDPDNGESHYIAEYYDRGDPRRLVQLDDVVYGNTSLTPTRRSLFGITNQAHAQHITRWLASSAFYRRQSVRFQTEYDGRIYKRGDPISVETWFASKMQIASVVDRVGDTLLLDRSVTVAASDRIVLRDRSGRQWGPVDIETVGTTDEITLNSASRASVEAFTGLTLDKVIALDTMEETTVQIGAGSTLTRHFLVKTAKPSGRDRMDIEAVIDRQEVWDILDEPIIDVPDPSDAPDPLPPDNITVAERLYLESDEIRAAAMIFWRRTDPRALTFEVEYRIDFRQPDFDTDPEVTPEETATDGQWVPVGATSGTSIEILDIPASQIDIRVRSIYSATGISSWAYRNNVQIAGVLAPPSDVTGFEASVLGDLMTLAWNAVSDIHLQHYELRFSPNLSGVEWGTAVPLISRVTTPGAQVPAASGTYLVKAVSRAGITSAHAAFVVSDVAGISQLNAVERFIEQPGFSGAKTDLVINTTFGGLQLTYSEDVYAREDWYAPGQDWYLGSEGLVPEGTYTFPQTLDLGGVYTSRLTAVIDAFGINLTDDIYAVTDVYAMEDFYQTAAASLWDAWLEYRVTNDDPAGAPVWGEWRTFVIGDVTARAFQFRMKLASYEFGVTPIVTRLEVSIDMPDRVIAGDDIAVPAAGLRIQYVPPFIGFEGLATTGQGMASGDRLEITNKDTTGFDARFFSSAGTPVSRTLDYVAKGYGRRES